MRMYLRRKSFVAALVVVLCSFGAAVAEDQPLRGRLPDGRAFRTDAQRIQIVDYIAELELSIEALNRRIRGLEDELKEKNNSACGVNVKNDLKERDLLGGNNNHFQNANHYGTSSTGNNSSVSPVVVMKNGHGVPSSSSNSDLMARLAKCEAKVNSQPIPSIDQRRTEDTLKLKLMHCEAENKEYQVKVSNQQNACSKVKSSESEKEITKYKKDLDLAKLEVKNCINREELLTKRIKDLEALNYQNSRTGKEQMASFKDRPLNLNYQNVRDELNTEFKRLKILLNRRSALYSKYQEQSSNLKVRLTPLRSANNRNLDSIKYGIQFEDDLQALNMLRLDLKQILNKIQDDINLLLRISK